MAPHKNEFDNPGLDLFKNWLSHKYFFWLVFFKWLNFYFNPHQRICSLILERDEGKEREEHPYVPQQGSNPQPRYVP